MSINQFLSATVNLFTDRMKSELHLETETEALSAALQQKCRGSQSFPLSKVILNVFIKPSFRGEGNRTEDATVLKDRHRRTAFTLPFGTKDTVISQLAMDLEGRVEMLTKNSVNKWLSTAYGNC